MINNMGILSPLWHIHMMDYYAAIKITFQSNFNGMRKYDDVKQGKKPGKKSRGKELVSGAMKEEVGLANYNVP